MAEPDDVAFNGEEMTIESAEEGVVPRGAYCGWGFGARYACIYSERYRKGDTLL